MKRNVELPPLTIDTILFPGLYLYGFEENSEYNLDKLLKVKEILKDGGVKVIDYTSSKERIIKISEFLSEKGVHWFYSDNLIRYTQVSNK